MAIASPSEILRMRGVSKVYPEGAGVHPALRRVDITVAEGEFLAITGPSGSGKTTFLHLAALLDRPTSGDIWFEGSDTAAWTDEELGAVRKFKVAMIFQNYLLLPYRSALENVAFRFRYMDFDGEEAAIRARAALARMGMAGFEGRAARKLSAGEMQRVAIARAIVQPPRLLAADEPTGNLDAESAATVMECLTELHRSGMTILLVTHNESLLAHASRHLVCINGVIEG